MANSDKNILITPNRNLGGIPDVTLTGAGNSSISLKIPDSSTATLNFESSNTNLLSIDSNLTGSNSLNVVDYSGRSVIEATSNRISLGSKNESVILNGNGLELPSFKYNELPAQKEGSILYDSTHDVIRYSTGSRWAIMNNKKSGLTYDTAGESAAQIIRDYPNSTYGVYWIRPSGQTIAYQCYCLFNYLGNDWFSVSGLSASGVRGDVNGNSSGLAGLRLYGENIEYAALGGGYGGGGEVFGGGEIANLRNASNLNFTLPRDWINSCNPRGLRVRSVTQDMTALFNRSGNYVTIPDIWSYYYAMNNYNNIPLANGRRDTNSTVSSWLSTNVTIYQNLVAVGVGQLWTGNHHCGWSDNNHMLHGSTNQAFPGSYPGFCLDGTCWNEAGIVWLAGT